MSDQKPDTSAADPAATRDQPTDQSTDPATSGPAQPGRLARWRAGAGEQWRRTRTGVVVALAAALLLGGIGGFALGLWAGHGPGGPGGPGPWGDHPSRFDQDRQAPPPGGPGQQPPATREEGSEQGLDG